ncbi:MAG TPA: YdiU family protein [Rubrivivax sp.]|nr:YdiU family protein [Rubrivivax sp.]
MLAPFHFDNSFARELEGLYVPWAPTPAPAPRLLLLNLALAEELGLDAAALQGAAGAALLGGTRVPDGAAPLAQAYAGHQFGGFSPQLGDGRALLLGEVIDRHGRRRDIAFKGSGRTPFARGGDGQAALGPVLREYLMGEAMHALAVPTTRALAVVATGAPVFRERELPGAVLTRVAASHLRVGSFEFFAARGQRDALRRLAEYAIARHDPDLADREDRFLGWLEAVARRQARLVAQWMNLGFIHGVMNTDNVTISGETIDYGPCAFLEAYDPATVFSSIDHDGRYAFGNQPGIARWNLARLAEALLPLLADEAEAAVALARPVVDAFPAWFDEAWRAGQRVKLGLAGAQPGDAALADDWLALLQEQQVDFTLAWRALADFADGDDAPLQALVVDRAALQDWTARWRARLVAEGAPPHVRAAAMRRASPWVIPRNHRVEAALAAAVDGGDLGPFEHLLAVLRRPYEAQPGEEAFTEPAARELTARYRTFCGT